MSAAREVRDRGMAGRLVTPRSAAVAILAVLAGTSCAKTPDTPAASALHFTQRFYDWYAPSSSFERVVHDSTQLFGPELLGALRQDLAASAADSNEIVGLDWDPFVASQDPCETYRAGTVIQKGDTLLVEVRGICGGRPAGPKITAVLTRFPSGWRFVNFRYDEGPDLLTELANLRRERSTAP